MNRRAGAITAFVLLAATCLPAAAQAADLKALVSGALKLALPDMIAAFEKSSGNKVTVVYGPGGAVVKSIGNGDVADVAIAPSDLMENSPRRERSSPAATSASRG